MNEATSKSNEIKEVKKELKYLLIRLGIFIAVIWLLFAKVMLICRAPDNGMFPAIKSGDLIIGFRITGDLRRDDVILYEHDGKIYTGRVMGCEGDIITIDESGSVYVNGTQMTGEIMYPTYPREGAGYPLTIEEDSVFVLGDYRLESADSRDFGCIKKSDIKAKVDAVFRRKNL